MEEVATHIDKWEAKVLALSRDFSEKLSDKMRFAILISVLPSDLQHAFVRRPDRDGIEIQSLDVRGALQPNVLDLLRDSDDSGLDSPTRRRRGRRFGKFYWTT